MHSNLEVLNATKEISYLLNLVPPSIKVQIMEHVF